MKSAPYRSPAPPVPEAPPNAWRFLCRVVGHRAVVVFPGERDVRAGGEPFTRYPTRCRRCGARLARVLEFPSFAANALFHTSEDFALVLSWLEGMRATLPESARTSSRGPG
jgi:hypothetical protein